MRVAIVNDLAVAREALRRVVLSEPGYSVAWTASDGEEAVAKARRDPPDVILMDLVMPVLDGVEATRRIMGSCPCPIVVVTSDVAGRFGSVTQAMGLGALDAVVTPSVGPDCQVHGGAELLARLARLRGVSAPPTASPPPRLVALGASTGGPEALAKVLAGLPADLPAGVLIVQHISADFAVSLASSLRCQSGKCVRPAREGDVPRAGEVLVAASDDHLFIRPDGSLGYTRHPASCPYRPSVDVLFHSLAERWPRAGVAVLLTGMGGDGAAGLAALREKGWHTIAQDQASSVVYGMPRVAAELRAACEILPLGDISGGVVCGLRRVAAREPR